MPSQREPVSGPATDQQVGSAGGDREQAAQFRGVGPRTPAPGLPFTVTNERCERTNPERYGENLRRAQDTWVKAVESWTNNVQSAFTKTSADNPFGAVDPTAFVDQYFDMAQEVLDAQRNVAKNMAKTTQSIGQGMGQQAASDDQSTQP